MNAFSALTDAPEQLGQEETSKSGSSLLDARTTLHMSQRQKRKLKKRQSEQMAIRSVPADGRDAPPDLNRRSTTEVPSLRPASGTSTSAGTLHRRRVSSSHSMKTSNSSLHLPTSMNSPREARGTAAPPRLPTMQEEPPFPTLREYLTAESNPSAFKAPLRDVVWGQTERERVYNALLHVPAHLERLMWWGMACCCDAFLSVFTVLPYRSLMSLYDVAIRGQPLKDWQVFDCVQLLIFGATATVLRLIPAGVIYYWMKDITPEFLKIHALHAALQISDVILNSFTIDMMEALSGTCSLLVRDAWRLRRLWQLTTDATVTFLAVLLHATVIMCSAMVLSVAVTSRRNVLVALLITSNFVEIKGSVYKSMNESKMNQMVMLDINERFGLLIALSFVLVEDAYNSRTWPDAALLWQCAQIFGAEIFIDIVKHSVLSKVNNMRPGMYREYFRDMVAQVEENPSHGMHKVCNFGPFGPAALLLRNALTGLMLLFPAGALPVDVPTGLAFLSQKASMALFCVCVWMLLFVAKLGLGYGLKCGARYYTRRLAGKPPGPRNSRTPVHKDL